jgi:hypothetical protein
MSLGELKAALSRLSGFASSAEKLIGAAHDIHKALSGTDAVGTLPKPPEVTLVRQLPGAPITATRVPVRTLEERVAIIAGQIVEGRTSPQIIESARAIVSKQCRGPNGKSTWCIPPRVPRPEIEAVFYAIRDQKVRYVSDPVGVDLFSSARSSLKTKGGDCGGLTAVLGAHIGALGHPCELVVIQERGSDDFSHVYLRTAFTDESGTLQVLTLDPSVDEPAGWECPKERVVRRVCFEVPG